MATITQSLAVITLILWIEKATSRPHGGDWARGLGPGGGLRCRVTNQAGDMIEEKACPFDMSCIVGGRLEDYDGTDALISYFCEVPTQSKSHTCRVLEENEKILLENKCPSGTTCTKGPRKSTFRGHPLSIYECKNPDEVLPKLCSVVNKECPGTSYWFMWNCRDTNKYYFCDEYPEESVDPPSETQFVCDVWGGQTGVSKSECPSGETCSPWIPSLLQDGTEVKALVCMLDAPGEMTGYHNGGHSGHHKGGHSGHHKGGHSGHH